MTPILTIRDAQLRAFERERRAPFIDALVAHAIEHFPMVYDQLGYGGTRARIEAACDRARAHRLYSRRDTCRFVDIDLALGPSFDDEPWALAILGSPRSDDERARALVDAAIGRLRGT